MSDNCRRKGPDLLVRSLRYLALGGWLVLIVALWIFDRAKPRVETFFERYYGIHLRNWWDLETANFLLPLLGVGLAVGIIGLVFNAKRHRRRSDEWRISLWLLMGISLLGLLAFYLAF